MRKLILCGFMAAPLFAVEPVSDHDKLDLQKLLTKEFALKAQIMEVEQQYNQKIAQMQAACEKSGGKLTQVQDDIQCTPPATEGKTK